MAQTYRLHRTMGALRFDRVRHACTHIIVGALAGISMATLCITWVCLH